MKRNEFRVTYNGGWPIVEDNLIQNLQTMCRFLVYIGKVTKLSAVLVDPPHSLIRQTFNRHLPRLVENEKTRSPDDDTEVILKNVNAEQRKLRSLFAKLDFESLKKMTLCSLLNLTKVNSLLNADGFGIGFYLPDQKKPIVYNSLRPAYSDRNLARLCPRIQSGAIFGHIRAASPGTAVTEYNAHPFNYREFLFMRILFYNSLDNGGVAKWSLIKRKVLNLIPQELYIQIEGTTDSETIFFLFLSFVDLTKTKHTVEELKAAMRKTIKTLTSLSTSVDNLDSSTSEQKQNIGSGEDSSRATGSSLNFAVTVGGKITIVTRYRNHRWESPPSLYIAHNVVLSENSKGMTSISLPKQGEIHSTIIASEPFTYDNLELWHLVPKNTMLTITEDGLDVEKILVGTVAETYFTKWAGKTPKGKKRRSIGDVSSISNNIEEHEHLGIHHSYQSDSILASINPSVSVLDSKDCNKS